MKSVIQPAILRIDDLQVYLNLSKSTIYNKLSSKSIYYDPTFPTPIKLSGRAVGWKRNAIDAWLDELDQEKVRGECQ